MVQNLAKSTDGLDLRRQQRSTWPVVIDDFFRCLKLAREWTEIGAKGCQGVEIFLAAAVWRPLVGLHVEKSFAVELFSGLDWWIEVGGGFEVSFLVPSDGSTLEYVPVLA